ncbi:helix-turn-helix transcriptional regulator [Parvularcula sp. LCG005]|uniref:helix-turn-helix transcriptional regulator n=1 Tax=Parvularcula sp. LCG005 TaxID=3078805 RepID=UPI0029435CC6|nr:helix-turn-helix transcriptional regulator [Parvularcula sp. LCG005]WOI52412.1 helix-turn-helix transcriptional regulator [Parvularcula sp. LCG005]
MAVSLTESDVKAITRLQEMLHHLPQESSQSYVREILTATATLIGAGGAFASYFFDSTVNFIPLKIGPQIEEFVRGNLRGFDSEGYFDFADETFNQINRFRRSMGSGVYHEAKISDRAIVEQTSFFKDAFSPAGLRYVVGMAARQPIGEALFAFGFDGPDDPAFNDPRTEAILELLLPSFVAGFDALYQRSIDVVRMTEAITQLPVPAMIECEDRSIFAMNELAKCLPSDELAAMQAPQGSDNTVHRLPGPVMPGFRPSQVIMRIDNLSPTRIRHQARNSFGLTPRQAEVADFIVRGQSDNEIAAQLGISVHTARRHSEAVLDRLGISSRSAVLLALMGGERIRQFT